MTRAPQQDWHPEDIKAAIRKTGVSLTALSRANGLSESAVRRTLIRPWPRVQAIIAQHLGLPASTLWPSRYDARGRPLSGLRVINGTKPSGPRPKQHCQKTEAA